MSKIITTNCQYCNYHIGLNDWKNAYSWQEMTQMILFRKANHELIHLLNGTDVYSQMERGLKWKY